MGTSFISTETLSGMHSVLEIQKFIWLHHTEIRLRLKCPTYLILLLPSICSLHKGQNPTSTRKEENSPAQKGNDEHQEQAQLQETQWPPMALSPSTFFLVMQLCQSLYFLYSEHWKARSGCEVDIGGSIRSKYKICICNHFSVYCFFPSGRETSGRNFLSGPQLHAMLQDSSGVMVLIDFVFCGICHTGHLQYHTGGDGGNTTGVTEQSHSMLPHILPCT